MEHTEEIEKLKSRPIVTNTGGNFDINQMYDIFATKSAPDYTISRLEALEKLVEKNLRICENKDSELEIEMGKLKKLIEAESFKTSDNFAKDRKRIRALEEREYPVQSGGGVS